MWDLIVVAGLGFLAGVAVVDLLWIYFDMKKAPEMEDDEIVINIHEWREDDDE